MIIEVDKKYFIALMATILVVAGGFFVVSYGTGVPSNFGHSVGELELTDVCMSDGTNCPATVDLCVCIQTYSGAYSSYSWSTAQCSPLGSWSGRTSVSGYSAGSRAALVLANSDGTCTPPA